MAANRLRGDPGAHVLDLPQSDQPRQAELRQRGSRVGGSNFGGQPNAGSGFDPRYQVEFTQPESERPQGNDKGYPQGLVQGK